MSLERKKMLIWFVALYLLATVAIGFYASTRVHNTRDFASGGRSMGFPIVAAILIGLVESLGGGFISYAYKDAYPFLLLVLLFIFKPEGLTGGKQS